MSSSLATHSVTAKPTGIRKLPTSRLIKPTFNRRYLERYFWYYDPADNATRLATSTDVPHVVPEQVNAYIFNPSLFAQKPYPLTFPPGGTWPPGELSDLLWPLGSEGADCVGEKCYTDTICEDPMCGHTFDNWKLATEDWEEHFELRMTADRGLGVFTKSEFKDGDVLGWYAGELKRTSECTEGDYVMEMEIGVIPIDSEPGLHDDVDSSDGGGSLPLTPSALFSPTTFPLPGAEDSVVIDGSQKGNWTRFINHSCKPYSMFRIRRVGNVRIMAVEAIREIPVGVELTVSYGPDYYGLETRRVCRCGVTDCVGLQRRSVEREPAGRVD